MGGTGNTVLDAMLVDWSWGTGQGTGQTAITALTYSFMTAPPSNALTGEAVGFQPLSASDQAIVSAALKTVSAVANITFTLVADDGTANLAYGQMQMATNSGETYGYPALTHVVPGPVDIDAFTNGMRAYFNDLQGDETNFWLVLHELGNQLGISDFSGQSLAFDASLGLPANEANLDYTVMANNYPTTHGWPTEPNSYSSNAVAEPPFSETPQMLDILALQYLYGANETGYTADNAAVTAAGLVYSFTTLNRVECIWVGNEVAGKTIFDFSACVGAASIDLNAGSFSSSADNYNNISIAYGAVIPAAVGNNGTDSFIADTTPGHGNVMIGGNGADTFAAGGGTDIFVAGSGADKAVFHDPSADYSIENNGHGVIVVIDKAASPSDGTVALDGHFTSLQFTDTTISESTTGSGSLSTVSAPASAVSANLDTLDSLAANGYLTAIALTDQGAVPSLTVSIDQLSGDAKALGEIATPYRLVLADSAATLEANLASVEALAAADKLASITLTDQGVPTFSVTSTEAVSDAAVFNDISSPFSLTVSFSGSAGHYSVAATGDGIGLTVADGSVTDHLSNVQALHFSDLTEIIAATPGSANAPTSGNITELYAAVLAREPDVAGLAFYQTYLKANPSTPLQTFADYFLSSSEYASTHNYAQSAAGDTQFINDSYQNLLHRTPIASEVSFYEDKVLAPAVAGLTAGTTAYANAQLQAHALMLVYFSASAEFLADVQITAQNPVSAQHWLQLI